MTESDVKRIAERIAVSATLDVRLALGMLGDFGPEDRVKIFRLLKTFGPEDLQRIRADYDLRLVR